jgi:hypothetical protein
MQEVPFQVNEGKDRLFKQSSQTRRSVLHVTIPPSTTAKPRSLSRRLSCVDREHLPRDVFREIAGEEQRRVRDVISRRHFAER